MFKYLKLTSKIIYNKKYKKNMPLFENEREKNNFIKRK